MNIFDILKLKYFDNTIQDYLLSIILFFFYLFIFELFKSFVIRRLNKLIEKDNTRGSIIAIRDTIKKFIAFEFLVIFSLYLAVSNLVLPTAIVDIVSFLFLFLISWFALKFLNTLVDVLVELQLKRTIESRHIAEFIKLLIKTILFIIVALAFLHQLGVNLTAYLAGLSVIGLAIAFALQNILTDIFASIILYFDKPFEVGDSIKVGADSGVVEKIGIRSTQIRSPTGNLLVISNRDLSTQRINNMKNMNERRVILTLNISVQTSVSVLRELPNKFEELINSVENTRFSRAHLINLGSYSFDFEIAYFITSNDYLTYLDAQHKVDIKILEQFEKDGIELPYPTQSLYIEKINSKS